MRRWLWRALTFGVLFGVADVALVRLDFAPDHLRLLLLMAVGFVVLLLLLDALSDDSPGWNDDPVRPMAVAGSDHRLAGYVRLIESHLTAAVVDAGVRDRLALLCDERLARRHGLTRQDPAARELLGDALLRDLAGPARRLTRAQIGQHLERIERL